MLRYHSAACDCRRAAISGKEEKEENSIVILSRLNAFMCPNKFWCDFFLRRPCHIAFSVESFFLRNEKFLVSIEKFWSPASCTWTQCDCVRLCVTVCACLSPAAIYKVNVKCALDHQPELDVQNVKLSAHLSAKWLHNSIQIWSSAAFIIPSLCNVVK